MLELIKQRLADKAEQERLKRLSLVEGSGKDRILFMGACQRLVSARYVMCDLHLPWCRFSVPIR
jgi:hypothetical protein